MADREPIRVGPLTLRWHGADKVYRAGYRVALANGSLVVLEHRGSSNAPYWLCTARPARIIAGDQSFDHVLDGLRSWLTETGYLAQYRSRRRLLARECERRAHHARQARLLVASPEAALRWRMAGDKYARWANQLKDSP